MTGHEIRNAACVPTATSVRDEPSLGDFEQSAFGLSADSINEGSFTMIPCASLLQIAQGVILATKTCDDKAAGLLEWITSHGGPLKFRVPMPEQTGLDIANVNSAMTFRDWQLTIDSKLSEQEDLRQLARLALSIALIRENCLQTNAAPQNATVLATVWRLIHGALTSPLLTQPLFSAFRSAQGFIAVPLCSLLKDGKIDALFRLHVWLPDGQRGNPDLAIHSHQPFAQSWILAGEAKDRSYSVNPTDDPDLATHAEYALAWSDGKNPEKTYRTIQTYSIVERTARLVRATPADYVVHTRDMTYTIPAAQYHSTEVQPDTLHATLFFFDSRRGFEKDARVLGPKNAESFTQLRDPGGMTPGLLANKVDMGRRWEDFMQQGNWHAQQAELELALRAHHSALNLCGSLDFPNATRYRHLVLGELGNTNRGFGRYEQAKDLLEEALSEMGPNQHRVEFSGELGVVYRHMNRLADAKRAFQLQYNTAKQLKYERASCRAIGNLGMVNYQLYKENNDETLLDLAIKQLTERVESARRTKAALSSEKADHHTKARQMNYAVTREVIGLSRLSLCYSARGNQEDSIAAAQDSLRIARTLKDCTVIAFSSFFYGRALLANGQHGKAMDQFNLPTACPPAIALCKEPSEEHLKYLRELLEAGVDLDVIDSSGYSTLDYAVFSGDEATQQVVLACLKRKLGSDADGRISRRLTNSKLKRGYRELFQEKLRPVLLSAADANEALPKLRRVYADSLAANQENRRMFDRLKVISYSEFLTYGKLPHSSNGLAQYFQPKPRRDREQHARDFVIFISYTRINKDPSARTPDDAKNTQYHRMLRAIEQFLALHPSVDRNYLNIWLDHTCVDQDDPQRGVSALPMIIAQCDAVISLIDDRYYNRAWCSLEAVMVQTLKESYGLHLWYEHVCLDEDMGKENSKSFLREGPMALKLSSIAEKELSFEEDRPKLLFLERQSQLLG
ncbi:MAG: hypothetical protein Q9225_000217 [Loekoesia sp. 1 TL-2023]